MLVTPGYLHFHGLDASDKSKDGCVFAKLHLPRLQNHGHLYITFSNMTKMLSQFIFTGKALRSKIFNLRQQVHICWAASCLKNSTRCTHHYPTWWVNAPRIQDQYISKGTRQKLLSGFFPLKGYTPPPLNGKSFCQKTLSGKGGYTPPLTENHRKFSFTNGSKRAKISVFWPKIGVF